MKEVSNPYQPLFALGSIFGVLGVAIWWFFDIGLIQFYPRQSHIQIMFFAFFWCFVSGFLMTAIPRMTGTKLANNLEVWIAIGLVSLQFCLNYLNKTDLAGYLYVFQLVFLLGYILPRFSENRKVPFDGFVFMPAAFFMALIGLFVFIFDGDHRGLLIFSGEAFLLNLIVGLGSRLIPALSRLPNAFMHPGIELKFNYKAVLIKLILFNISFIVDYLGYTATGDLLKSLIISYIAVVDFGLLKKGIVFSWVGLGLKASVIFIILGYTLRVLTASFVPSSHFVYIGGFSLLTMMVATRITLAHSQTSLDYELSSNRIMFVFLLLVLASVMRWWSSYAFNGPIFWISIVLFSLANFVWLEKHMRLVLSNQIQKD